MSMQRTLEPEVMDDSAEVQEYLEMDHHEVNQLFIDNLTDSGEIGPRVIDLGCGTAEIPILLCQQSSEVEVLAIDYSIEMLEAAKIEIELGGVAGRIYLEHADCKSLQTFDAGQASTVISNSLCHHLPHPGELIRAALHLAEPSGRIFLRDLIRPQSKAEVESLVHRHASEESEFAQQLLRQSLHASLTLEEVTEMAVSFGIPAKSVSLTSDRHWTIDWKRDSEEPTSAIDATA